MNTRRTRAAAVAFVAAVVGVGSAVAGPTTAPTTWSVVTTPEPPTPMATPQAISCVTSTFCMSVGYRVGTNGLALAMAQRFDGTRWNPVATPNLGSLEGVSCVSVTRCVAVGSAAMAWNGTAWTSLALPAATDEDLHGVSCWGASGCIAVGEAASKAVSLRWNGTAWRALTTPSPTGATSSTLRAISCVSVSRCVAVGGELLEVWNGAKWSISAAPHISGATSAGLWSVSCSSSTACMGVGTQFAAGGSFGLAQRWNGSRWSVVATPTSARELWGVSCKVGVCLAVGDVVVHTISYWTRARAIRWGGAGWTTTSVPQPGGGEEASLSAVSCVSSASCRAAGTNTIFSADEVINTQNSSLYEAWNGSTWKITPATDPGGALRGHLDQVSCASATACVAVGNMGILTPRMFADVWNGTSWRSTAFPQLSGASYAVVNAVSCSSATACLAVGTWAGAKGPTKALVVRWNGSSWALATPAATTLSVGLNGVSCHTATHCVAVGTAQVSTSTVPFAETWNGSTWTVASTVRAGTAGLDAVSCWSSSGCLAVGPHSLAETWNGTTWAQSATPSGTGDLAGVSCPAVQSCVAVGNLSDSPRWATWNGTSWTIGAMVSPANSGAVDASGISCTSATACVAVGGYCAEIDGCDTTDPSFPHTDASLTEQWNGSTWTLATTPHPINSIMDSLSSVSCPTGTACLSVGWMFRYFQMAYGLHGS